MSLDDQIRELCATAASTKEPASLFRALHDLKELIREHDLSREIGLAITEKQRLAANHRTTTKGRLPPLQS
jgi:hypothetical protein